MMVKEMSTVVKLRPKIFFVLFCIQTIPPFDIILYFFHNRQNHVVFTNKIKFCRQDHVQARAASPPPPQHDGQRWRDSLPPV